MRSKPWTLALALLLACAGLPVRAAKTCIDADIGIDSRHHAAIDPSAGRGDTVANIHTGYGEDMLDRLVAEINGLLNEPAPRSRAVAVRWGGHSRGRHALRANLAQVNIAAVRNAG